MFNNDYSFLCTGQSCTGYCRVEDAMKQAKLTKRVRYCKVGDTIVVPLGMVFPHAVLVEKTYTDDMGQMVAEGITVAMEGCSNWRVGERVGVCVGWK